MEGLEHGWMDGWMVEDAGWGDHQGIFRLRFVCHMGVMDWTCEWKCFGSLHTASIINPKWYTSLRADGLSK